MDDLEINYLLACRPTLDLIEKDRLLALGRECIERDRLLATSVSPASDKIGDAITVDAQIVSGKKEVDLEFLSDDCDMDLVAMNHAVLVAREVVNVAVNRYYNSHLSHYRRLAIEKDDVSQYCWEKVVAKRYMPMIANGTNKYTVKQFRRSLYSASWKACISHYRAYITSQCRGTLHHRSVCLDDDESNFEASAPVQDSGMEEVFSDDATMGAAVQYIINADKFSRIGLRKSLKMNSFEFEEFWERLQQKVKDNLELIAPKRQSSPHFSDVSYDCFDEANVTF